MKKTLLFMASAMVAGALCAGEEAQFYEMEITLKTTKTMSGTPKQVACDCRVETNSPIYRKQSTIKIKGAIWGCGCGTLIKGIPFTTSSAPFGYFFWNVTDGKPLAVNLTWHFCNRIEKAANKCEAVWMLESADDDVPFFLTGAGFGTLKDVTSKSPCMLVTSYFTKFSGNCAGWVVPGAVVTTAAKAARCSWCEKVNGTPAVVKEAKGWAICSECGENLENPGSAASGTWKIKYNASVSKKMTKDDESAATIKITDFYNFPSYVVEAMNTGDQKYEKIKAEAEADAIAARAAATAAAEKSAEAAKTAADDDAAATNAEVDAKVARKLADDETDETKKAVLEEAATEAEAKAAEARDKATASKKDADAAEAEAEAANKAAIEAEAYVAELTTRL